MNISRIVLGLLSAQMATAVFAISQNARAQECTCTSGGGVGCPSTFAASSFGNPAIETCNVPYYWYSGAGAATILQDQASSTSGAYAAKASSLNNVAILAYTNGGPAAIIAQSQTTTVPTETSAISAIAASGTGVYAISGSNDAIYGDDSGQTSGYSAGVKGVSGSAGGYGVVGSNTNEGVGVLGKIPTAGVGFAIWGENNANIPNAAAGWFHGNVYVTGNLEVQGQPYCNGTTCGWMNYSDIKLKKNVQPLTGALERLLKLRGVTYEWKEPENHGNETGPQTGFIAQEVEQVMPNVVGTDLKGLKTITLRGMDSLLVESIRTLKAENDGLRSLVEAQDERLRALEANRRPLISGLTAEGTLFGIGFVAIAGASVVSRRKRSDSSS